MTIHKYDEVPNLKNNEKRKCLVKFNFDGRDEVEVCYYFPDQDCWEPVGKYGGVPKNCVAKWVYVDEIF